MNLAELLDEDGEEFIEAAYLALLKRRADPAGARGYLRALHAGTAKLAILYELYHSAESRDHGVNMPGLLDAFARDGIGEPPDLAQAAAEIHSADQLLAVEDADRFAAMAYRVLLKRPADLAGLANCQARLHAGTSRTQILHELFSSDECRRQGTKLRGLREVFQREGMATANDERLVARESAPIAESVEQLLQLHGAPFVESTFATLHQRSPDEQELDYFTGRLRAGDPKLQLLDELAALPSGSGAVKRLPGLSSALFRYRLSRLPVVGVLFRRDGAQEGRTRTDYRARVTEQRLFELEGTYAAKVAQLQEISSMALALAQQATNECRDLNERNASLERSMVALRKLVVQHVADAPGADAADVPEGSPRVPDDRLLTQARAEEIFRDLRQAGR